MTHLVVKLLQTDRTDVRTISGYASTADVDRVGDVVVPEGMRAQLPIPLLSGHDQSQIIGAVTALKPDAKGVRIEARIVEGVARADEAWALIKQGALTSFSIGFMGLKSEPIKGGGRRWTEWELTEVSAVAVPANRSALITSTSNAKSLQSVPRGSVKLLEIPRVRAAYETGNSKEFLAAVEDSREERIQGHKDFSRDVVRLAFKNTSTPAKGVRLALHAGFQYSHMVATKTQAQHMAAMLEVEALKKRVEQLEAKPSSKGVVWLNKV